MNDFGLYVVMTSPREIPYEKLTEACVAQGVRMLQLREKLMCDRERLALARRLGAITRGSATKFIVNDRVDIALSCGADGVHVGQEDIPIEYLRAMSKDLIAGLSTHSITQASDAILQNPDYIAFGPVFATPAKSGRDAVTGTHNLTQILKRSPVPVVAIGGICEENIRTVLASGVRNIALIRAVDRPDAAVAIRNLQRIIAEF